MYICIYIYVCIYICIYVKRERDEARTWAWSTRCSAVARVSPIPASAASDTSNRESACRTSDVVELYMTVIEL